MVIRSIYQNLKYCRYLPMVTPIVYQMLCIDPGAYVFLSAFVQKGTIPAYGLCLTRPAVVV